MHNLNDPVLKGQQGQFYKKGSNALLFLLHAVSKIMHSI